MRIKSYWFFVVVLFVFCCTQATNAQYKDLVDTLKKSDQSERRRVLIGFLESHRQRIGPDILTYYKVAEDYAKSINDKQLLKDIDYQLTKKKRVFDKPSSTWKTELEKLANEYHQKGEWYYEGGCYHELSQFHFQREEYEPAFQNAIITLKIFKKNGYENTPSIGKALHEIALNYYVFQDYPEVIKLMKTSITLPAFSRGLDMQRYNNLAMAYLHLDKTDSAKYFLNKTFALAEKYNSNSWKSIVSGSLGNIYFEEKDFQKALKYYKIQVDNSENQEIPMIRLSGYINLSKAYLNLDFTRLAQQTIEKAEDSLNHLSSKFLGDIQQKEKLKKSHFENRYAYALKTQDYKSALIYKDSLNKISERIAQKYNTSQIEIATIKLRIKEDQLKVAETEAKKIRQNLGFLLLIILTLTVLGFILFRIYNSRIKIKKQNERLLTETKIASLKKSKKNSELVQSKIQLNRFIQKINEQKELVKRFRSEFIRLKRISHIHADEVDGTIESLKKIKILTDEDWVNFKFNFRKAYPELMYKLKKYNPTLTSSEKRYLMLASLSLSNKEMANVLGVSEVSIRVTRSRVRKKIEHLPEEITAETIKKALEQSTLKNKSISVN